MTDKLDTIKEKITALLVDDGRTPEEAEQAQLIAAKLMARHGLSPEDLETAAEDMLITQSKIGRYEWVILKQAMSPIGRLTGTKPWFRVLRTKTGKRSDRKGIHFAGTRPDVQWAEWLTELVIRHGVEGAKALKTDREKIDFLTGYSVAVTKRILDLCEKVAEQRDGETTALVVVKDTMVADFLEENGIKLSQSTGHSSVRDAAVANAGRAVGQKVALGRPVGGGKGSTTALLS